MINETFNDPFECSLCYHYICTDPANLRGLCSKFKLNVRHNEGCAEFKNKNIVKEGQTMIKFGDLLPLINSKFVVDYKGEIYHSFGNTLQSVLREHFKDLTVKELTTYDEECLKVVIK